MYREIRPDTDALYQVHEETLSDQAFSCWIHTTGIHDAKQYWLSSWCWISDRTGSQNCNKMMAGLNLEAKYWLWGNCVLHEKIRSSSQAKPERLGQKAFSYFLNLKWMPSCRNMARVSLAGLYLVKSIASDHYSVVVLHGRSYRIHNCFVTNTVRMKRPIPIQLPHWVISAISPRGSHFIGSLRKAISLVIWI